MTQLDDLSDARDDRSRHVALVAEAGRGLSAAEGEPLTLKRIVARALEVVGAADACGITLRERSGEVTTGEASDEVALAADRAQYDLDEGPCLDSATGRGTLVSDDLEAEQRWPRWADRARALGLRSVLSIHLRSPEHDLGALNLYARRPAAFDEDDVDLAEVFSVHAAQALDHARLVDGLRTALHSRHQIGVAQGIVMARYDIGLDQAFEVLRRLSSHRNLKLRDIAAAVVAHRGLPPESDPD